MLMHEEILFPAFGGRGSDKGRKLSPLCVFKFITKDLSNCVGSDTLI